jgi:hypothetical protein
LLFAVLVLIICFLLSKHIQGAAFALAVLIIAVAHFVMANFVFTSRVQAAPAWFGRLLLAVLVKWLIVILLMLFFMRPLKEAPLMAILGVMASLMVIQVFNYLDAKVNRGS